MNLVSGTCGIVEWPDLVDNLYQIHDGDQPATVTGLLVDGADATPFSIIDNPEVAPGEIAIGRGATAIVRVANDGLPRDDM